MAVTIFILFLDVVWLLLVNQLHSWIKEKWPFADDKTK
jgi:hypothetical protein